MVVGSVRPQKMTFLHLSSAPLVWALEVARIFVFLCGCVASGWAVGFGMGYSRGADDAATRDGLGADERSRELKESPIERQRGSAPNTMRLRRLKARPSIRNDSPQPSASGQYRALMGAVSGRAWTARWLPKWRWPEG
jgi:hypothetical protein